MRRDTWTGALPVQCCYADGQVSSQSRAALHQALKLRCCILSSWRNAHPGPAQHDGTIPTRHPPTRLRLAPISLLALLALPRRRQRWAGAAQDGLRRRRARWQLVGPLVNMPQPEVPLLVCSSNGMPPQRAV